MGERKEESSFLSPRRKIFKGEKGSAEEKHGCDKKKYRQVKHINGRCDAGEIHADGAKGDAAEKSKRQYQEAGRVMNESEQADYNQHDSGGDVGGCCREFPALFEGRHVEGGCESVLKREVLIVLSYWEKKQINNSAWTGQVWIK